MGNFQLNKCFAPSMIFRSFFLAFFVCCQHCLPHDWLSKWLRCVGKPQMIWHCNWLYLVFIAHRKIEDFFGPFGFHKGRKFRSCFEGFVHWISSRFLQSPECSRQYSKLQAFVLSGPTRSTRICSIWRLRVWKGRAPVSWSVLSCLRHFWIAGTGNSIYFALCHRSDSLWIATSWSVHEDSEPFDPRCSWRPLSGSYVASGSVLAIFSTKQSPGCSLFEPTWCWDPFWLLKNVS